MDYSGMQAAKYTSVFGKNARGAEAQGFKNLYQLLQNQGRIDPRLLASMQAQNSRATQQQMDAARGRGAASGFGGGGLNAAIQASIGAAGANRAANLNYQDIADAYGRNQQDIGLMNQVVTQPQLGYSHLIEQRRQYEKDDATKRLAARLGFMSSMIGGMGKGMGG